MAWLYDLPLIVLFLLCLGVCVGLTVGGILLVRRCGWILPEDNSPTAYAIHAFVGVVYAVLLGLIVIGVQQGYDQVDSAVVTEAAAASDLYRTMEGLEEPKRTELQELVLRYLDRTVKKEWPAVQHARNDEETWQTMDSVARGVFTYTPVTEAQKGLFPELLQETERLLDARRQRLFLGTEGVGPIIWTVVLMGGLITLGFVWFFHTPSLRAHLMMGGLMSAMYALMIFLIISMDHPLWGAISVKPAALETVEFNMHRWRRERAPAPAAPLPK